MEQSAPSQEGEEYDLGDNGLNDSATDDGRVRICASSLSRSYHAFDAMRHVLTVSNQRPMFIVDWGEHLLTTANQQDLDERSHLTKLGKGYLGTANEPTTGFCSQ